MVMTGWSDHLYFEPRTRAGTLNEKTIATFTHFREFSVANLNKLHAAQWHGFPSGHTGWPMLSASAVMMLARRWCAEKHGHAFAHTTYVCACANAHTTSATQIRLPVRSVRSKNSTVVVHFHQHLLVWCCYMQACKGRNLGSLGQGPNRTSRRSS